MNTSDVTVRSSSSSSNSSAVIDNDESSKLDYKVQKKQGNGALRTPPRHPLHQHLSRLGTRRRLGQDATTVPHRKGVRQ